MLTIAGGIIIAVLILSWFNDTDDNDGYNK